MESLLFLAHRIPYPPNKGDKIRSYHFLKRLASENKVYLAAFIDDKNDWQYIEKLKNICAGTCFISISPKWAKLRSLTGLMSQEALSLPYYRNKAMQDWISACIKQHEITKAFVFSSVMAQYINKHNANVQMAVDFVDVDSDKWRQYAEKKQGLEKWVYQREAKFLLSYEREIALRAKISTFVSEQEADLFKRLASVADEKISYIHNGVDIDYFNPELSYDNPYPVGDKVIVFTGAMDYWANVDSVKWFVEHVFAKISAVCPQIKFYIVGSNPTLTVQNLAKNNHVVVTGAVVDVRPYLAYACLVVAPLRIARGIQNKVLEAMAMAKPIVATTGAMEGIPYDDQLDLSICDDADAMFNQLKDLLAVEPIKSDNNRTFVQRKFNWPQSLQKLSALF
ncbi:MAG: TIGR03087 family PEP-CTERM/XrtA system glycosyltransferase [Methylococcaceae bacterium]|jgi:sugar transferase (PEP-CTERM/EpsH1 system associated)